MLANNSVYVFDSNIVIYESLKGTIEKDHPLRLIIDYFLTKITEKDTVIIPELVIEESINVIKNIFEFLINVLRELHGIFKKNVKVHGSKVDPYIAVEYFFDQQHSKITNNVVKSSGTFTYEKYITLERYRRLLRHLELKIIEAFDSKEVQNIDDALSCIKGIANSIANDFNIIMQRILNIDKLNQSYKSVSLSLEEEKVYSQLVNTIKPRDLSIHESDWRIIFWQFFYQWIKNTYLILITVDFRLLKNKEKLEKSYMIFITSPLYATKLRERIANIMGDPKREIHNYASISWANSIKRALMRRDVI